MDFFKEGVRYVVPAILVSGVAVGVANKHSSQVEAGLPMRVLYGVSSKCVDPGTDQARVQISATASNLNPFKVYGLDIYRVNSYGPGPIPFEKGTIIKVFPTGTTQFNEVIDGKYIGVDGSNSGVIEPQTSYDVSIREGVDFGTVADDAEIVDLTPDCPRAGSKATPTVTASPTPSPVASATPTPAAVGMAVFVPRGQR